MDLDRLRRFIDDPAAKIGRYEIVRELGRGGTAVVYEAYDPALGRRVALKVLKDPAPERLRREAEAAARLRHPNVVAVHDVADDHIAMELLAPRAAPLDVAGLKAVAEAVAHAHANGIVHRDLKPSNILAGADGRPVLTDFGLARRQGTDTRTGGGTAPYMAPEQVRGETAGPAADVWALGVLLYEILAGRRPFDGPSDAAIYERILRDDPAPLAGPLGAVAAKALRKDPSVRYPDAGTFAAELRRHLAGEAVEARPEGPMSRAVRRVRRHPLPFVILLAGLALTTAIVLWRAERGRAIEAVRTQARLSLDAALDARRRGDVAGMRKWLGPLEAAARAAPETPEVDYLLGRLHRALLDDARALECQDRAIARTPGYLPAWYERMVLLSRAHAREMDVTHKRSQRVTALADEIVHIAERLRGNPVAAALIHFYEGRHAQARAILEAEVALAPDLDEAWDVLMRAGRAEVTAGWEDAERRFAEAEAAATRAIVRDRGYVPALFARSDVRHQRGSWKKDRGLDPLPDYAGAEADLTEALRVDGRSAEAYARRGLVRTQRGVHRVQTGGEATADLRSAVDDLSRALELDPGLVRAWTWRGNARYFLGEDDEGDFTEALRREPGSSDVRMRRGRQRARAGRYAEAEADFAEAVRLAPKNEWAWQWWGDAALAAGKAEEAEGHYARSIEAEPSHFYAWKGRAEARWRRGDFAGAASDWRQALALNPRLGADLEARMKEAQRRASE
ncbi:MAG TPA: serine/threonine-protein kinase [Planctomycetota bacterium]|nr:serine/threonine-protein kinase [Planctomycetota bacterium]